MPPSASWPVPPRSLVENQWSLNASHIRSLQIVPHATRYAYPLMRDGKVRARTPADITIETASRLLVCLVNRVDREPIQAFARSTPCNFGGVRWWFECNECSKLVQMVYINTPLLSCRNCAGLVHRSTRTSHEDERLEKRAERSEQWLKHMQSLLSSIK